MRIIMTILMVFVTLVVALVVKINHMHLLTEDSLSSRLVSDNKVSVFSGQTPIPDSSHYVSHRNGIELTYPQWYNAKLLHQGDIYDRLRLLPEQDRKGNAYLVVSRLGMIVPIISLKKEQSLLDISRPKELKSGAIAYLSSLGKPLIIAGHTSALANDDGYYNTIFQSLVLLQTGDVISLYKKTTSDRRYHYDYRFLYHKIVDPTQSYILEQGDRNTLILYGCYPFGSNQKRIVVGLDRIR